MAHTPLRRISRFLLERPYQSDPVKRAFIQDGLLSRDVDIAVGGFMICLLFHLMASIVEPFVVERHSAFQTIWVFRGLTAVWVALYFLFLRKRIRVTWATLPMQVLTLMPYWLVLHIDVTSASSTILKSWTAFLGITAFSIVLLPFHRLVPLVQFLTYTAATVYTWSFHPVGRSMIPISVLALGAAYIIQRVMIRKALWDAAKEYDSRQALSKAERAAIESELALAREIQDSLTPPQQLRKDRISANFHHAKHTGVGGDWMGLREISGKVVAVIADATGKGIQAALVIHAVQSLWAEMLDLPEFDALVWMQRVNQTLLRLGERKPHTVSLGIAVFEDEHVTWYSAGHLPLFVARLDNHAVADVEALTGRGGLLGMFPQLSVEPVRAMLPADGYLVVAGSDGVFEKGTAHSKREISAIISSLHSDPVRALQERPAADDKSVLIVEKAA
jgi:hypothetical protein